MFFAISKPDISTKIGRYKRVRLYILNFIECNYYGFYNKRLKLLINNFESILFIIYINFVTNKVLLKPFITFNRVFICLNLENNNDSLHIRNSLLQHSCTKTT